MSAIPVQHPSGLSKYEYAMVELMRYYQQPHLDNRIFHWLEYFEGRKEDIRDWDYIEEAYINDTGPRWKTEQRLLWKRR